MLGNLQLSKIYLYVLAVICFFIMLGGAVDTVSAVINLVASPPPAEISVEENLSPAAGQGEMAVETLYQKRMFTERVSDSVSRFVISGAIFAFLTFKLLREEKKEA